MAARETGFGAVEQYMHAGKLLALELLVRVFENPHHHWTALRPQARAWLLLGFCLHADTGLDDGLQCWLPLLPLVCWCCACIPMRRSDPEAVCGLESFVEDALTCERRVALAEGVCGAAQFCEQLRQPLCLALLRNCTSPYDEAYSAAARLFGAILLQPRLRSGLKAELGAFYPLLLLRPLEAERPEPGQLFASLAALHQLCGQAQFLVRIRCPNCACPFPLF